MTWIWVTNLCEGQLLVVNYQGEFLFSLSHSMLELQGSRKAIFLFSASGRCLFLVYFYLGVASLIPHVPWGHKFSKPQILCAQQMFPGEVNFKALSTSLDFCLIFGFWIFLILLTYWYVKKYLIQELSLMVWRMKICITTLENCLTIYTKVKPICNLSMTQ